MTIFKIVNVLDPENKMYVNDVMPFVQNGKICENMWSGR